MDKNVFKKELKQVIKENEKKMQKNMKKGIKPLEGTFRPALVYILTFLKWCIIAICTGMIGGLVGTLFHKTVEWATNYRTDHDFIMFLLPVGGVIIVLLYKLAKTSANIGTNEVISSIRTGEKLPVALAPLIFISTAITHLLGGSAGREGAALQLGGSIGTSLGRISKLDEKDMHTITLCGMSGVFAALFGTPLAASFFALEVVSVGVIYYSGLIPCILTSLVAFSVSVSFGIEPLRFSMIPIPETSFTSIFYISILAIICAGVSIFFCLSLDKTKKFLAFIFKNEYLRIIAGAVVIVALSLVLKTRDYNGAGMGIITDALNGIAKPEAFFLKILFTSITIGCGFKGGEIVPTLFIGATLGCVVGGLLGLGAQFGAAVGLIAMFCSVVNCPIAGIILSIEVFGSEGLILFAIACAISFMFSGYYGLYNTQKIMYSKLKAEFININTR